MTDAVFTLQGAADELGVHYMTAYRYVRLGVMDASKSGGVWQVSRSAIDRFRQEAGGRAATMASSRADAARQRRAPWSARLESRLIAGDAQGSWSVIEAAMAAGAELDAVYLDILTPAMASIGERWVAGQLEISVEHWATAIATRIVGRIGPRFVRRGRSRGVVALGAPAGEVHALPVAMLGDLLRLRGWEVFEFGVDMPSESIAHVVRETPDLLGIGLSAMASENLPALGAACAAAREADPDVLVVVGGRAVLDDEQAVALGAHGRAVGAEELHQLLAGHAETR